MKTEVKERPMLFSTPMVIAIIDDRKDITRRTKGLEFINEDPDRYKSCGISDKGHALFEDLRPEITPWISPIRCPYGIAGDVLWVRETCAIQKFFNGLREECFYIYKTDYPNPVSWNWKPSIFMPREACRLKLEIKYTRVERLHEISPDDADREGVERWNEDYTTEPGALIADYANYLWVNKKNHSEYYYPSFPNPIDSFRSLWIKINGKESWDLNPWVWRIEFCKINQLNYC